MKQIETYIINLKRSVNRKNFIWGETDKYPFLNRELIEAIDGRLLSEEELNMQFDRKHFENIYARSPFPGEIGCTLSHLKCYQKLLDSDEAVALILEDDIHFLHEQDTKYLLQDATRILENAPATLLYLQPPLLCWRFGRKQIGRGYSIYSMWNGLGSAMYLINRKGAEKILSCKRPYWLADHYELFRLKGVHIRTIYPTFATIDENIAENSDISMNVDVRLPRNLRGFYYRARIWIIKQVPFILKCLGLLKLVR
ncbi:MAG: glycosyltransferase family 25 protein [Parabacteroides sp.]|nr:glycosyltransferase family 25 protein [Parabacteroides sp.]